MLEVRVSKKYKKEVKKEAISAIISISLMLIFIPTIVFIDFWFYALPLGIILIPFWIKIRWKNYDKELKNIHNHKLTLEKDNLVFHYKHAQLLYDLSCLKALNVNMKKGVIESINLIFNDDNFIIAKYEKMNTILKHLQTFVGKQNTVYHK